MHVDSIIQPLEQNHKNMYTPTLATSHKDSFALSTYLLYMYIIRMNESWVFALWLNIIVLYRPDQFGVENPGA